MSIKFFTGIPGSGKTYRVVYDVFRTVGKEYFVTHNIEGFKGGAVPGGLVRTHDEVAAALGVSVDQLWCASVQKRLCEMVREQYDRPVLVIVDEAQLVFGEKNRDALEWLSQHRHNGQDVWLIAQDISMLERKVQVLGEVEIRAKRGAAIGLFLYQWRINGETYHTDRRPRDKAVQMAYLSAAAHTKTVRSKLLYVVGACVLACIGGGWYFLFGGGFSLGVTPSVAAPAPLLAERAERASGGGGGVGGIGGASSVGRPGTVAGVGGLPPGDFGAGSIASLTPAPVRRYPLLASRGAPGQSLRAVAPVSTVEDEKAAGPVPDGWRFAGYLRGVPYVHNGADLRKASELLLDGWQVVGGSGENLICLHPQEGTRRVAAGSVAGVHMWFGLDG